MKNSRKIRKIDTKIEYEKLVRTELRKDIIKIRKFFCF